jgi:myo-inositol-1-phosphate synthase
MDRLGVCVIGAGGAVSSTIMAGVALMKKGLVPRHGMITETGVAKDLDVAPLDGLVFGGWDLRADNASWSTR